MPTEISKKISKLRRNLVSMLQNFLRHSPSCNVGVCVPLHVFQTSLTYEHGNGTACIVH